MRVVETIEYDFAGNERHGIVRDIPAEFAYDDTHRRVYPIDSIEVSSPTPELTEVEVDHGPTTSIRIGDPDELLTGAHTIVLRYNVRGVVNALDSTDELYWNAIGTGWDVPIDVASATVEGPAAPQDALCFQGSQALPRPAGSPDDCSVTVDPAGVANVSGGPLLAGEGMTVVVAFPSGTFPDAQPVLQEIWSAGRAFEATALTVLGSLAILILLCGGAIAAVSQRGRDERYLGATPDFELAPRQQSLVGRVPWRHREPVAVRATPPSELRPGELGTLLDERANVVDVTATIVDLAVRGHLRIEEVDHGGTSSGGDWRLVRADVPPPEALADYEQTLLQATFDDGEQVTLSELRQGFRQDLSRVQGELYAEVTRRGWFRGNPRSVRRRWAGFGFLLLLIGAVATFALARWTHLGLLGLALVVSAVVLLVVSPRMPARTARGTALLAQAKGFRLYLESADAGQLRLKDGVGDGGDVYSRYLPYAIVFGVAPQWTQTFARLAAGGAAVALPTWYVGRGWAGAGFSHTGFAPAIDSFATTTAGSISAATPSSSGSSGFGGGGFVGGGAGGGGGGSW